MASIDGTDAWKYPEISAKARAQKELVRFPRFQVVRTNSPAVKPRADSSSETAWCTLMAIAFVGITTMIAGLAITQLVQHPAGLSIAEMLQGFYS